MKSNSLSWIWTLSLVLSAHLSQVKFNYEGTYALYVGWNQGMEVKWITNQDAVGVYKLTDQDGKVLSEGKTEAARTHSFTFDKKPTSAVKLLFGSEKGHQEEIELRPKQPREASSVSGVDRVYVLGDIHGRYQELIGLLQNAKVIDQELHWAAGKAHLVFLGDLFDRGDDVTKVLWFIYRLEAEAKKAGGQVHLVLGNHEIMTMTEDLRYVGRKEKAIALAHKMKYDELFHPTKSLLGVWLRSKVSVFKMDQILFAHGGILELGEPSLEAFNTKAYQYMGEELYLDIFKDAPDSTRYDAERWWQARYFFYDQNSPYWFRGYVYSDTLSTELNKTLRQFDSKVHVVAHTPVETITERYKGKLLTTDLKEAATELLLLEKKGKKYERFKIGMTGDKSPL